MSSHTLKKCLGVGRILMDGCLDYLKKAGFAHCVLHSQVTVVPFYEKFGFVTYGDEFKEADIRHLAMKKDL